MSARHDWNTWDAYLTAHENRMRDYEYFVVADGLRITEAPGIVRWRGVISCLDGIEIHVTKQQEVSHHTRRPMVRTVEYTYHVQQRIGSDVRQLFRYDNVGDHGEADRHHCHEFAPDGSETIVNVGVAGWPTLGDVLARAARWWEDRGRERAVPPPNLP